MKKSISIVTAALAVSFLLFSCGNGKYPGFKKTTSGLYYKIHKENKDADKPELGDVLTLQLVYKTENDSTLMDTRNIPQPFMLPLEEPAYPGDIYEAMTLLSLGDSASFIIGADSFFLNTAKMTTLPNFIKAGSILKFDMKLEAIKRKAEIEKENAQQAVQMENLKKQEDQNLAKYLEENKIKTESTASGLYYIEVKRGNGEQAVPGKKVKVHYVGSFLDGKQFDSSRERNEPFEFILGQGQVIPGWDEGVSKMRVGGKTKLIIPSHLAYGQRGAGQTIPPYSTLVFEVELLGME